METKFSIVTMLPAAPGQGHTVNKATAAEMLGLSVVTFDNWTRKGLAFTKQGREVLFNLADVVRFIEAEATARATANNPVTVDIEQSKARKLAAEASLAEMELQQKRGELVPIAEVARTVGEEYAAVRAKLLAIPSKVAPMVAAESTDAACRALLTREIHDAMLELVADAEKTKADGQRAA